LSEGRRATGRTLNATSNPEHRTPNVEPRTSNQELAAVTLLESLLNAIIRLEGDALVMHVGEKPYVVTTSAAMGPYRGPLGWGQVELSTKILPAEAVFAILNQILPTEKRQELDTLGAVDHELPSPA